MPYDQFGNWIPDGGYGFNQNIPGASMLQNAAAGQYTPGAAMAGLGGIYGRQQVLAPPVVQPVVQPGVGPIYRQPAITPPALQSPLYPEPGASAVAYTPTRATPYSPVGQPVFQPPGGTMAQLGGVYGAGDPGYRARMEAAQRGAGTAERGRPGVGTAVAGPAALGAGPGGRAPRAGAPETRPTTAAAPPAGAGPDPNMPAGVDADWWEAFKGEHQGEDAVSFYSRTGHGIEEALADRDWGDAFFRDSGRKPNQREWKDHFYQTGGYRRGAEGGRFRQP